LSLKKFGIAFAKRETVGLEGTQICFISYEDLINEKQENGRSKDIIDIEQLKIRKS